MLMRSAGFYQVVCTRACLNDQWEVNIMSNNIPGPEFWNRANALINLANDQCDAAHPNEVASSNMYAAARFNAFIVAQSTGSAEKMQSEKAQALEYFVDQFRRMMENNLDDFAANFDKYMGDSKS
jgi:hypothetical protein